MATPTIVTPVRGISWSVPASSTSQPTVDASGTPTFSVATAINGSIVADCIVEERSEDESVITENPVETGSVIADHAYDLPQELDLIYAWSAASISLPHFLITSGQPQPSTLNTMYEQFLTLKQQKVLLSVTTGKRSYSNMLIKGISQTTDKNSENILQLRITLRQLILAATTTATVVPPSQMTQAGKTMPTQNMGTVQLLPAPNYNSGIPAGGS